MLNKILSALVLVCIVCLTGCSNGSLQNNTSKTSGRESNLNTSSAIITVIQKPRVLTKHTIQLIRLMQALILVKILHGLNIMTVRIITVALIIAEKCFLGVLLKIFQTLRYLKTDTAVWKKQM